MKYYSIPYMLLTKIIREKTIFKYWRIVEAYNAFVPESLGTDKFATRIQILHITFVVFLLNSKWLSPNIFVAWTCSFQN